MKGRLRAHSYLLLKSFVVHNAAVPSVPHHLTLHAVLPLALPTAGPTTGLGDRLASRWG